MGKSKKIAKKALKSPGDFTYGELAYFKRWLEEHKQAKAFRKKAAKEAKRGLQEGQ